MFDTNARRYYKNRSCAKAFAGLGKSFKKIRKLALIWMNVFLRETEKSSSGPGLTIEFSKSDDVEGSTDLF